MSRISNFGVRYINNAAETNMTHTPERKSGTIARKLESWQSTFLQLSCIHKYRKIHKAPETDPSNMPHATCTHVQTRTKHTAQSPRIWSYSIFAPRAQPLAVDEPVFRPVCVCIYICVSVCVCTHVYGGSAIITCLPRTLHALQDYKNNTYINPHHLRRSLNSMFPL